MVGEKERYATLNPKRAGHWRREKTRAVEAWGPWGLFRFRVLRCRAVSWATSIDEPQVLACGAWP